jgi:signal transduction histidine kinase
MRVLVVEDHRRLAEAVAGGLRDEGMAVDVAFDGQDALDHADLARYDVIVLDRDLHAARAEAQRRQLHLETSLQPAPMLGDPSLIERLAVNLLDNAVRHNTAGGTVQLTTGQQEGRAVITVANTGPVIPPAQIARLFRPFERLAPSRASNGDGHGLGLPIVAAIAAAHDAKITAHARPEGGLHIQVSFPGQPPGTTRTAEPRQLQKT